MPLFRGLFLRPFYRACIVPCTGFYIGGISAYTPAPIAGLMGLYRGIIGGFYIGGLCSYVPVLCSCVLAAVLVGLWAVLAAVLHWGRLAPCPGFIGVYSIDSGGACVNRV